MIELITGTPGAGKTLMCVSRVLRPMVGAKVTDLDGNTHERRLCIGGITDLLLPHESVTVRPFDPEKAGEPSDGRERKPGDPPLDVEMCGHNWWQWCMPGDVIVIDECQRLFRPMASGRKLPLFIAMLETHRHYGIDLVLITQHPQLIHGNVRSLIGKHRHVRRLFGGLQRMVYEWDQCSAVDRRKDATAAPWRPDKSAYELYKSAEIHTKSSFSVPLPLIVAGLMLVGLPASLYYAYNRVTGAFTGERVAGISKPVPAPVALPGSPGGVPGGVAQAQSVQPVGWPASGPVQGLPASAPDRVVLAGCIADAARCKCWSVAGLAVDVPAQQCREAIGHPGAAIPVRAAASSVWLDSLPEIKS